MLFKSRDYNKKNIVEKIFYFVIELPFNILRDLSIPPCEKERWKQGFFILMPLTISIFIIISFKRNKIYKNRMELFYRKLLYLYRYAYSYYSSYGVILLYNLQDKTP